MVYPHLPGKACEAQTKSPPDAGQCEPGEPPAWGENSFTQCEGAFSISYKEQ